MGVTADAYRVAEAPPKVLTVNLSFLCFWVLELFNCLF